MDTNLTGTLRSCQIFGRHMLERGYGRMANIVSLMGRFGWTEELVGAVVYLCSDAMSFVTGQTLVVDPGFLASGLNQSSREEIEA